MGSTHRSDHSLVRGSFLVEYLLHGAHAHLLVACRSLTGNFCGFLVSGCCWLRLQYSMEYYVSQISEMKSIFKLRVVEQTVWE